MNFIYTYLFFTIIFCFSSCSNLNQKELNTILNSKSKILYFEKNTDGEIDINKADFIIMDVENNRTHIFKKNIFSGYTPRLSRSSRYIATFDDIFPHSGKFKIFDLKLNKDVEVELQEWEGNIGLLGITDYDFFNDSTLIFSAKDNFCLILIKSNIFKLYKNINGKQIIDFIMSPDKEKIAFSYIKYFDSLSIKHLAIYDLNTDSIDFINQSFFKFENWNPSGEKFIFASHPDSFYFFDAQSLEIEQVNLNTIGKNISEIQYFTNDKLLIQIFNEKENNSELFLFDTNNGQFIRQLTSRKSKKFNTIVYNKLDFP